MDQSAILKSAQKGDHIAFAQLFSTQKEKMYRIAFTYFQNEPDALEAIQEVTFRAYIDDIFYQIFANQYYDEAGNEYEAHNGFGFHTGDDESEYISYLRVNKPDNGSNVIFKITDFPTRISEDIKIQVK